MGEKDLFEFWSNTYKVSYGMEWSREVAAEILSEWQAKFGQEVSTLVKEQQMQKKYQINAFSSSYLNNILVTFSEFNIVHLALSYLIVVSPRVCKNLFLFSLALNFSLKCAWVNLDQLESNLNLLESNLDQLELI